MPGQYSIRLGEQDLREPEALSMAAERSRTFLINKVIMTCIAEYNDYRVALDRLPDKDDEPIGSSEIRGRLGI